MNLAIQRLRTSDVDALKTAAAADNHGLFFQSHIVTRAGEIVGSLSQSIPVHTAWLHSKKLSAAESFSAIRRLDEYLRLSDREKSLCLCSLESPFFEYMPRLGYREAFRGALFERVTA